jgi:hypothetical protein
MPELTRKQPKVPYTLGMARKRFPTVSRPKSGVVVVSTPAATPVRRRRARAPVRRAAPRRRRRSSSTGGRSDKGYRDELFGVAIGGFGFGWLMKHYGTQIPSLPLVGRSGTVALASYFLRGKHPIVRDVGIAAASIAGYSFGKTGTVEGADYEED